MADTSVRPTRCPKGHAMDPNWETCAYCDAEQKSNQRSGGGAAGADAFERQGTVVPPLRAEAPDTPRVTRAMAGPAPGGGYAGAGDTRQVTGVLITYDWEWPQGKVFEIREGKNFIGSGKISSEAEHRDCDIQILKDTTMSAEHALILCRQGNYEILDQISSNGTFLNEKMLKANQGTDLPNYAQIRTGSTSWTFIMARPPAG